MHHHCKKNPLASSVHPPKSLRNIPGSLSVQPPKGLLHGSLHRNSSTRFFWDVKDLKNFKVLAVITNYHQIGSPNLGQNLPFCGKKCQGPRNFERNHPREQRAVLQATNLHKGGIQQQQQQQYSRVDGMAIMQGKRDTGKFNSSEFVGLHLPHPTPCVCQPYITLQLPAPPLLPGFFKSTCVAEEKTKHITPF